MVSSDRKKSPRKKNMRGKDSTSEGDQFGAHQKKKHRTKFNFSGKKRKKKRRGKSERESRQKGSGAYALTWGCEEKKSPTARGEGKSKSIERCRNPTH